jgi:hypothetical protein
MPQPSEGRAGIDVISPQGGESGDIERLLLNIALHWTANRSALFPVDQSLRLYLPVS